jgi:hypothetical protein
MSSASMAISSICTGRGDSPDVAPAGQSPSSPTASVMRRASWVSRARASPPPATASTWDPHARNREAPSRHRPVTFSEPGSSLSSIRPAPDGAATHSQPAAASTWPMAAPSRRLASILPVAAPMRAGYERIAALPGAGTCHATYTLLPVTATRGLSSGCPNTQGPAGNPGRADKARGPGAQDHLASAR